MKYPIFLFLLICIAVSFGKEVVGKAAPGFKAVTFQGDTLQLSDYRGKVVLLDIWASWCIPCRAEFPFLVDLYDKHKGDAFEILAVNIDRDRKNAEAFLKDLKLNPPFPVLLDPASKIPPKYDLKGMPTTVFIDRSGTIRLVHTGFKKKDRTIFEAELKKLLKDKPGGIKANGD